MLVEVAVVDADATTVIAIADGGDAIGMRSNDDIDILRPSASVMNETMYDGCYTMNAKQVINIP